MPTSVTGVIPTAAEFNDLVTQEELTAAIDNLSSELSASNGATLVGLPNGTVEEAILYKTVDQFGAIGDGTTDDTAAIQLAANWVCAVSYQRLLFNPSKTYRITAPVTFHFASDVICCVVDMQGSIIPDVAVGNAFTFTEVIGGTLNLSVVGRGASTTYSSLPDYSTADPTGEQQAFIIDQSRSVVINVIGYGYAGRVLRTQSTGELKTSFLDISIRTGDETSVLANGQCGQAMYLQGADSAFGTITKAQTNWDVYGSILDRLTDISIGYWEAGAGYLNPTITMISCESGHTDTLALGGQGLFPALKILDSSDGSTATAKVSIKRLFGTACSKALEIIGADQTVVQRAPLSILSLFTYNTTNEAVAINNVGNVHIHEIISDDLQSYGIVFYGTCRNIRLDNIYFMNHNSAAILTDVSANIGGIFINGRLLASVTNTYSIDFSLGIVADVTFRDMYVYSSHYSLNLQSGNQVKILGGYWNASTSLFYNSIGPAMIRDTSSYISIARGTASFPSGSVSGATLIISHGLSQIATSQILTMLGAVLGANLSVTNNINASFTVTYTGPTLSADLKFRWHADCELR